MKQMYLGIFALLSLGFISVGSAYAIDTAFVDNGNLSVDDSSNVVASGMTGTDSTYVFDDDHIIAGLAIGIAAIILLTRMFA